MTTQSPVFFPANATKEHAIISSVFRPKRCQLFLDFGENMPLTVLQRAGNNTYPANRMNVIPIEFQVTSTYRVGQKVSQFPMAVAQNCEQSTQLQGMKLNVSYIYIYQKIVKLTDKQLFYRFGKYQPIAI